MSCATLGLVRRAWTFVPKYLGRVAGPPDRVGGPQVADCSALRLRAGALDNVLILARDEFVAALLGLLVELRGFQPKFPARDESPTEALARDQFHAVVVDCDHPAYNEELVAQIKRSAARPILFSPLRLSADVQQVAAKHGARSFTLPTDPETFGRILQL
jgi:DNA-binding NtrC family response regulator